MANYDAADALGSSPPDGAPRDWRYEDEWYWEGNVQTTLATHLRGQGWHVLQAADTASREAGIDLIVRREGQIMAIEVKGYPSDRYARGERRGQPKPTGPPTQARHWFGAAMLATMLSKNTHSDWRFAVAFPDFQTYRTLLERTSTARGALAVTVFLINDRAGVETLEVEVEQ